LDLRFKKVKFFFLISENLELGDGAPI
jgi:hypothetical protein